MGRHLLAKRHHVDAYLDRRRIKPTHAAEATLESFARTTKDAPPEPTSTDDLAGNAERKAVAAAKEKIRKIAANAVLSNG